MARRIRAPHLETRTARLKLPIRKKPHDFTTIALGIAVGYRRCQGAGRWVVRCRSGGAEWTDAFAIADDHENADGEHILDFWQAQDKARAIARGQDAHGGRPGSVDEALTDYEKDLITRGADPSNAQRVRTLLPASLLAKPVALLTVRDLKAVRDGRVTNGAKPASVNRDMKGLKAALNLAAAHDPRIANASAWKHGLATLPGAHNHRNVILTDDQVRAFIAAAYAENDAVGLLVETAAVSGARVSQLSRLEVQDLQSDRVMMPSSRKGKGVKRIERKAVPIPASLAAKLRAAAGKRAPSEPLLRRADGKPWQAVKSDYRPSVVNAVIRAGLDPDVVTLYALRHSSIARQILANTPIRLVATLHDTSVAMIEASYSALIHEAGDAIARRALFDPAQPPVGNVVTLPGRRS
jgi:integrase